MLRFAIFISIAAAVVTLFDQSTIWQFTLDPSHRLALAGYWLAHAALAGALLMSIRSLDPDAPLLHKTIIAMVVIPSLAALLLALSLADVQTLIEIIFEDAAPGAFLIIIGAFALRSIWRLFFHQAAASPSDSPELTWREALTASALAVPMMSFYFALLLLVGFTWRAATLFLSYAAKAQAWDQVDWPHLLSYTSWRWADWRVPVLLGIFVGIAIIVEKLLSRRATTQDRTQ